MFFYLRTVSDLVSSTAEGENLILFPRPPFRFESHLCHKNKIKITQGHLDFVLNAVFVGQSSKLFRAEPK